MTNTFIFQLSYLIGQAVIGGQCFGGELFPDCWSLGYFQTHIMFHVKFKLLTWL